MIPSVLTRHVELGKGIITAVAHVLEIFHYLLY